MHHLARPRAFLVAPDSFKGTFSAPEVASAIARGLGSAGAEADLCPLADGGEGTLDVLLGAIGGERVQARAHDPLGREITAAWGRLADGRAVVEAAQASGLGLLDEDERDPVAASTYGTGELIAAAAVSGTRQVLVAVGGSATTDGGAGAIEAIRDRGGLGRIAVEVLCDVRTPFEDAPRVFGPQKGADPETVTRLEARLNELAVELPRDPRGIPLTGAAGGLAGGLWAAFGADLRSGAAAVLDSVGFGRRLSSASAVVSGEGRLDEQSLEGKVVGEVAERARGAGTPLHLIVGEVADDQVGQRAGAASLSVASTLAEIEAAALILRDR